MDPGWGRNISTTTTVLWYSTSLSATTYSNTDCFTFVNFGTGVVIGPTGPEKRNDRRISDVRDGWREAPPAVVKAIARSARRLMRGFTRENIGCSNYCRSPA